MNQVSDCPRFKIDAGFLLPFAPPREILGFGQGLEEKNMNFHFNLWMRSFVTICAAVFGGAALGIVISSVLGDPTLAPKIAAGAAFGIIFVMNIQNHIWVRDEKEREASQIFYKNLRK